MYQVYSNELYHHGILGQKWGVRRFRNEDGSLTAAGKRRRAMSDDAALASSLRKKKISELSNDELRKLTERNQLENNYYNNRPSRLKRMTKAVTTVSAALAALTAVSLTAKKTSSEVVSVVKDAMEMISNVTISQVEKNPYDKRWLV